MHRRPTLSSALFALATGVALFGCALSDEGGVGGNGGSGSDTSMLRVAHLAPEVPAADFTGLDFDIADEVSFNSIQFAQVSGYFTLPPGLHSLTVTEAGVGGQSLASMTPRLEVGRLYTVVAYRDSGEVSGMSLMLFEESTEGLGPDSGRIVVGHGADDSSWPAVNVVDADTSAVLIADLMLGAQSESVELVAGDYALRFDGSSPPPTIEQGPFRANIEPRQSLILFVVDEDTVDDSVGAAVYAIGPDAKGSVPPLPPE